MKIKNVNTKIEELAAAAEEFEVEYNTDDAVKMYLHEIGAVPLLTAEQEITLAQEIALGQETAAQLEELKEAGIELPAADLAEMERLVSAGERAKKNLAEANLRLVVSIARRYVGRGAMFPDLIQEGSLGLMKAIDKFDYSKGFKLSTYATHYVKRDIIRYIAKNGYVVKLSEEEMLLLNRVRLVQTSVWENEQRDASAEEIAQLVNIPLKKARQALLNLDMVKYGVPLDAPISAEDSDGETMASIIPPVRDDGFAEMFAADTAVSLRKLMRTTLTQQECQLLALHHGFDREEALPLTRAAAMLGLSNAKANKIVKQAYAKLLAAGGEQFLRDCLAAA